MKRSLLLLICTIALSSTFFSCKKKDSPVPTTPITDTLGIGWSKVKLIDQVFKDIVFQNSNTGYLVGDNMLKSIEGGNVWNLLPFQPVTPKNISITPDGKLFVVNATDTIYRSVNGGNSFAGFKTTGLGTITDVYILDNTTGFAISGTNLQRTTDAGVTWAAVSPITGFPSASSAECSLFFLDAATGWLSINGEVYKSNGSVNSWTKAIFAGTGPSLGDEISLYATSASVVYAGCSNGRLYKSTNGGLNFSQVASFPATTNIHMDVHFVDANTGYACFSKHIYQTSNAGVSWQSVVSMNSSEILELHFVAANQGWACSTKGEVLKFN